MNLGNLALRPGPCSCFSLTLVKPMCPLCSNKDCQWHSPVELSWKPKGHSKWKVRLKVEISGFFGNSVVPCNVLLEAILWKHVLMKQTHERACDVFFQSRCFRWYMMFRRSEKGTLQTVNEALVWQCHATPPWSSLGFADPAMFRWSHFFTGLHFRERNTPTNFLWYSSWFFPLSLTHSDSVEPCGFCRLEPLLPIRVWHLLLDWTAGTLTTKSGIDPKNYF